MDSIFSPDGLITQAAENGLTVSRPTVSRHVQQGLFPKPTVRALGRGQGKVSEFTEEAAAEALASWTLLQKYKRSVGETKAARVVALYLEHARFSTEEELFQDSFLAKVCQDQALAYWVCEWLRVKMEHFFKSRGRIDLYRIVRFHSLMDLLSWEQGRPAEGEIVPE